MHKPKQPIDFFNTYISPAAPDAVVDVLRSERLSEGRKVKEFEMALEEQLGIIHPVAVNSGSSALHLAITTSNIKPGDEIILPAQTFVASGLVIAQQGATPVFADIQYRTGNIDPRSIAEKITERTKAIMVVHWAGLPVDLDEIHTIAKKYNLIVIEDAAHALGATYHSKPIGSFSDHTCFSFQAIKHLTTGDGGVIASLDVETTRRARAQRWFGIDRERATPSLLGERVYNLEEVGYKYHMNDYAAALGLANLISFKERLLKRRNIAALYREKLSGIPGVTLFDAPGDRESAHWLFGIHVEQRDNFIRHLADHGVPSSVVHVGIDRNDILGGLNSNLTNQRHFDETQIHIPIHDRIDEEAVAYITDVIAQGW